MTLNACLRVRANTSTNQFFKLTCYQFHFPVRNSHVIALNSRTLLRDSDPHIAHKLFDQTPLRDLNQHNHLLFLYSRNDQPQEALHLFVSLCHSGLFPEASTLSCVLNVYAHSFHVTVGQHVHYLCIKSGLLHHVSVGNSLVDMYMKTVNVRDGRRVFDEMGHRDVVSWNSLIAGYSRNEYNDQVWKLFCQMQIEGYKPNDYTVSIVIAALANQGAVAIGMQIHNKSVDIQALHTIHTGVISHPSRL